eukprot:5189686-Prymnesium_polylepis.1
MLTKDPEGNMMRPLQIHPLISVITILMQRNARTPFLRERGCITPVAVSPSPLPREKSATRCYGDTRYVTGRVRSHKALWTVGRLVCQLLRANFRLTLCNRGGPFAHLPYGRRACPCATYGGGGGGGGGRCTALQSNGA